MGWVQLLRDEALAIAFMKSVILDLIGIGWRLRIEGGTVYVASPLRESETAAN